MTSEPPIALTKIHEKFKHNLLGKGLVSTIQPESDFSGTYGFDEIVDDVKLIIHMKFQNILMNGCTNMGKKLSCDPPRFNFKRQALSLLYPGA